MVILSQAGPDNPPTSQLKVHTKRRVWSGSYTGASSGPLIKLTYAPKAAEMNAEIPAWVRSAVEGKLVWRLEFEAQGDAFTPSLAGKWYPGKIQWDPAQNDPSSVKIIGDGEPYEFTIERQAGVVVDALSRPTLGIKLATDKDYDPEAYRIEALLQGQRFSPIVTLPADMAKTQGTSLQVMIKGLTSGNKEPVVLTTPAVNADKPTLYTTKEPILIADCDAVNALRLNPRTLSVKWWRNKFVGNSRDSSDDMLRWIGEFVGGDSGGTCLPLQASNGETVELRFNDASIQLPIYDSWVQAGLARQREAVTRLRAAFYKCVAGSLPNCDRNAAHTRLQMLTNYELIYGSNLLTDLHRFYLGEVYFGDSYGPAIVLMTDQELQSSYKQDLLNQGLQHPPDPTYFNPLMQAFLEGLTGQDLSPKSGQAAAAIPWTSDMESYYVHHAIRDTSDQLAGNSVKTWAENFAFGLYDGLAAATTGGQLWLVATGTDHHWVKQSGWDRFFAAVGLASNALLVVSESELANAFLNPRNVSRLAEGVEAEQTVFGSLRKGASEVEGAQLFEEIPSSVSQAERESLMLRTVHEAEAVDQPQNWLLADGAPVADTLMESQPGAVAKSRGRVEAYMKKYWGSEAKFVDPWNDQPLMDTQTTGSCNERAASYIIKKNTGLVAKEEFARDYIEGVMTDQARAPNPPRSFASIARNNGIVGGYDNFGVNAYIEEFGGKVAEVPIKQNRNTNLLAIWTQLKRGYDVKVIVDFAQRAGSAVSGLKDQIHAIVVDSIVVGDVNGAARILGARIYDSNIGRLIEVPAKVLDRVLFRKAQGYSIMTVVKFGRKSP